MSVKNIQIYILDALECLKSHFGTWNKTVKVDELVGRETNHAIALDTAVLDVGEDQPGWAVEQGEYPAGGDDPPRPPHSAHVLNSVEIM